MTEPPPDDLQRLADFPRITIGPGDVFFRMHSVWREAAHFSNSGTGRFDAPRHTRLEYGTCYVALSKVGAFLETLGRIRPLPDSAIQQRVISEITPGIELSIADLTSPILLGRYGITGDLSVGRNYTLAQLWGAALRHAGFDGVHYVARHDPSFEERSVAIFGPPGEQSSMLRGVKDGEPIGDDLLQFVQERFGIFVAPTSGLE